MDGIEKCGGDTLAKKSPAMGGVYCLELVPIPSTQVAAKRRGRTVPVLEMSSTRFSFEGADHDEKRLFAFSKGFSIETSVSCNGR